MIYLVCLISSKMVIVVLQRWFLQDCYLGQGEGLSPEGYFRQPRSSQVLNPSMITVQAIFFIRITVNLVHLNHLK